MAAATFTRHASRYGTRRLRAELRAEGHQVGRYAALRTWLRASGLRALCTHTQRPRATQAAPAWWPQTCCSVNLPRAAPIKSGWAISLTCR